MGRWVEIEADDGFRLGAWRAEPESGGRGAVVVIQEIFGVNAHIREVCEGFARDGFLALAPALFDRVEQGVELGYDQPGMEKGIELARERVDTGRALGDVAAAVRVASEAGRVGVVGYCWGGLLAWLAASRLDGIACAVSYYGGGVAACAEEEPRCPVMLHFGAHDAHIPPEDVEKVRRAHPELPVHVYEADHGFNCDHRASFEPHAADLARTRTLEMFEQYLRDYG